MSIVLCLRRTSAVFLKCVGEELISIYEINLGQTQSKFLDIYAADKKRVDHLENIEALMHEDLSQLVLCLDVDCEEHEAIQIPVTGFIARALAQRTLMQQLQLDYPEAAISSVQTDGGSYFAILNNVNIPDSHLKWLSRLQKNDIRIVSVVTFSELVAQWVWKKFGSKTHLYVSIENYESSQKLTLVCVSGGQAVYSSCRTTQIGEDKNIVRDCVAHLRAEGVLNSAVALVVVSDSSQDVLDEITSINFVAGVTHCPMETDIKNMMQADWSPLMSVVSECCNKRASLLSPYSKAFLRSRRRSSARTQECCSSLRQQVIQDRLLKRMAVINALTLLIGFSVVAVALIKTVLHRAEYFENQQTVSRLKASTDTNRLKAERVHEKPLLLSNGISSLRALRNAVIAEQVNVPEWVSAAFSLHPGLSPEEIRWLIVDPKDNQTDPQAFESPDYRTLSVEPPFLSTLVLSLSGRVTAASSVVQQQQELDQFSNYLESLSIVDNLLRLRTPADGLGTLNHNDQSGSENTKHGQFHLLVRLANSPKQLN